MKTARKNIADCSIETVAALAVFNGGSDELVNRVVAFMGARDCCSIKGFVKAAQKSGWSRKATFAAVDAAAANETMLSVEGGDILRIG